MDAVRFNHVDVIFGPSPSKAVHLLDQGKDRDQILAKTENVVAVHDASLAVPEGEICVLMGLSGSGKSSLLRCVNGLNKVARGQVRVRHGDETIDLVTCDRATRHRLRTQCISMVFQAFALMPWRTVRENVAFGLQLSRLPRKKINRIVDEKLALVRLEEWADVFPRELSGGMQQRVGLARALATDADILLMDEPFSALDPLIREHLQDELLQLQKDLKKTILFVSHDPDEALRLGNQVAIMDGGRIIQADSPEAILSHPANSYVEQFVASMNPLKVLSCRSVMRPAADLERTATHTWALDNDTRCILDRDGCLEIVTCNGQSMSLCSLEDGLDPETLPADTLVTLLPKTPLRTAARFHKSLQRPLPVVDTSGRFLGSLGNREILDSLVGNVGNPL